MRPSQKKTATVLLNTRNRIIRPIENSIDDGKIAKLLDGTLYLETDSCSFFAQKMI
jgi:hypothetical protein